jgi:predicted transcriptional regulator
MKQVLVEIDDRCARDLERVAPAKDRQRSEFVRLAIRSALDRALDRHTGEAYGAQPLPKGSTASDAQDWDPKNALATRPRTAGTPRRKGTRVA